VTRRAILPAAKLPAIQTAIVLGSLALLALWPPERGYVRLVPLTASANRTLVATALAARAVMVRAGAGSIVVFTEAPGFRTAMLAAGIVPVSATGGCGAPAGVAA
jgi:hypothetical protein